MNSFYSNKELSNLGLKKIGKNVKISHNAQFYSPEKISIGKMCELMIFVFCQETLL